MLEFPADIISIIKEVLKKVAIIDYQMGNLFSVKQACLHVGLEPVVTTEEKILLEADAAILPGVGAFGEAMSHLRQLDFIDSIKEFVKTGKPFMGICLGMQLLFSKTEEFGIHEGIGIIPGKVVRFLNLEKGRRKKKVPHVGWNQINFSSHIKSWERTPLEAVAVGEYMYFVHSFYTIPDDTNVTVTQTNYENEQYCSAILHQNVFATQFHPEKSGEEGLKIYKKWASMI